GLEILDANKSREIEPFISCANSLWVPQSGIIDYRMITQALKIFLNSQGVQFIFNSKFLNLVQKNSHVVLEHSLGDLECNYLLNTCGLFSDTVAQKCGIFPDIQIIPFRGEYFKINNNKSKLINGLIYPVPDMRFPFLGVHITKMMDGEVHCGPNAVLALAREGYSWKDINFFDLYKITKYSGSWKLFYKYYDVGLKEVFRSLNKSIFLNSLQKMMPSLELEDLITCSSGVRAQAVSKDGKIVDDFVIHESFKQIHVLNAPSPAATSCFSLGNTIAEKIFKNL
ncbi:L-2-hydroxyglutarate oxidase, partial [bacterium]|nr:L-2-hydroxyglutarate oxidase [bacterium]